MEERGELAPSDFEEECKKDLRYMIKGISDDDQETEHLVNLYWDTRNKN